MSLIDPIGLQPGRVGRILVDGVADGYEAFALAEISRALAASASASVV